jgi:hypothetical protein
MRSRFKKVLSVFLSVAFLGLSLSFMVAIPAYASNGCNSSSDGYFGVCISQAIPNYVVPDVYVNYGYQYSSCYVIIELFHNGTRLTKDHLSCYQTTHIVGTDYPVLAGKWFTLGQLYYNGQKQEQVDSPTMVIP